MKKETKLKLAATAIALAVTGFLSQTASANPYLGVPENATLYDQGPNGSFVVESEALQITTPGPTFGEYMYWYQFGVNYPHPSVGIVSLSVFFDTVAAGPITGITAGGSLSDPGEIYWVFNPAATMTSPMDMSFISPLAPTLGDVSAHNGGLWGSSTGGNASGVVVPDTAVPDGGLTLSLLGGALVGIGALRRKFSC